MAAACSRPATGQPAAIDTAADGEADGVRGWLDRVDGKPRIGSMVNVVGWAAAERPEYKVERIEILLDGMEIGEAVQGVDRSDVADSYGNPGWNKSGWEAQVLLEKILPGEHTIQAAAIDSRGARHALSGARSITVLDLR